MFVIVVQNYRLRCSNVKQNNDREQCETKTVHFVVVGACVFARGEAKDAFEQRPKLLCATHSINESTHFTSKLSKLSFSSTRLLPRHVSKHRQPRIHAHRTRRPTTKNNNNNNRQSQPKQQLLEFIICLAATVRQSSRFASAVPFRRPRVVAHRRDACTDACRRR